MSATTRQSSLLNNRRGGGFWGAVRCLPLFGWMAKLISGDYLQSISAGKLHVWEDVNPTNKKKKRCSAKAKLFKVKPTCLLLATPGRLQHETILKLEYYTALHSSKNTLLPLEAQTVWRFRNTSVTLAVGLSRARSSTCWGHGSLRLLAVLRIVGCPRCCVGIGCCFIWKQQTSCY